MSYKIHLSTPQTMATSLLLCLGAIVSANVMAHDITNTLLTQRTASCADYVASNEARVSDIQNNQAYEGRVSISTDGAQCQINSNAVPNHDFNATGRFATPFREQVQRYTVTAKPTVSNTPTPLSLMYDNAIFLNGVKLDLMAAGCFGVGSGKIGCNDMSAPYRYDPMGKGANFGTDEHNAHTQPNGAYHYHGNPLALFEQDQAKTASPVIGFAADGFPIFGSFINDNGIIRKAKSSYQLKQGLRTGGPGGAYDGTFVDDWEYVAGSGDLDRCNGMRQDNVYGYVITDAYPHVMGCFTGTPDVSFSKGRPPR